MLKILKEQTDEQHALNATQINEELQKQYDIKVDRRTIYDNIKLYDEYGIEIMTKEGTKESGYYILDRDFELPELKLLVDAVQSSKFITEKKTRQLISKLESHASKYQASDLHREVVIAGRAKAENETIYYNVDSIHEAMNSNTRITFLYAEWNMKKELVPRHEGRLYQASPWALTWDDENYYLIAFDAQAGKIKHFRVDKMMNIALLDEPREGYEHYAKNSENIARFSRMTFGMFGGEEVNVTLRCKSSMVGVIIDRFGSDVMIIPGKQ